MKMKKLALALASLALTHTALACNGMYTPNFLRQAACILSCHTLDCGHWYVGANVGMSHVHDDPNPNSGDSVQKNGPGGSVVTGYQFNSIWGGEAGYTYYKNSRESNGSFIVAKTDHYAVHLAATARLPIVDKWSALGKLGFAYSYAQKIAEVSGRAASASAGSLYWGLGLSYSITPRTDFIAQFAEARGNHLTGSTDLWSIGFNFAIV